MRVWFGDGYMHLELRGKVQAGHVHLGDVGQRCQSPLGPSERRSEVLSLGSGREEPFQAG